MPIYDYRCVACSHEVEVIHSIGMPGPAVCDVCGGAMRKALSAPAIHFKGSGWAKKDAQKASKAAAKDKDKDKDKASTDDKSGGKADGKSGDSTGSAKDGASASDAGAGSTATRGANSGGAASTSSTD